MKIAVAKKVIKSAVTSGALAWTDHVLAESMPDDDVTRALWSSPATNRREVRMKKGKSSMTMTRRIAGRVFSVEVPATWDPEVEELLVSQQRAAAAELAIAAAVASEGPPSSAGFTFMRKVLGLTGKRLAELLGMRAETVSRWENDAGELDRAAWLALGGLVLERAGKPAELQVRMERLAEGFKPPKERRVEI